MRISWLSYAAPVFLGAGVHAEVVTGHSSIVEKQQVQVCTTIDRQQLNRAGINTVAEVLKNLPPGYGSSSEHGCLPPQPTDTVNKQALADQNAERASVGLPLFIYNRRSRNRRKAGLTDWSLLADPSTHPGKAAATCMRISARA